MVSNISKKNKPLKLFGQRLFQVSLIIAGVALLLRLPLLTGSFWLDEAAQALEVTRPWHQQLQIVPDFQPPLLHLMLHVATYAGTTEWWLRLVGAVIPGVFSVWATFWVGARFFSVKTTNQNKMQSTPDTSSAWVGLLASILLAVSSFHIFYSQELRPYALPAAWGIASWWTLLEIGKRLDHKKSASLQSNWTWWLGYAVLTLVGLYSSYLYPFLVLGQLGWWLISRHRQFWQQWLALGLAGAAFLPWLPMFFRQLEAGGQVRTSLPGWAEVVSIPQLKSIPLLFGKFIYGVVDLGLGGWFIWTSILLGLTGLIISLNWWRTHQIKPIQIIKKTLHSPTIWWLLVPLLTSWLVSFWIPVVRPKRLLFAMPALMLGLAQAVIWAEQQSVRGVRAAGRVMMLTLLVISIWSTGRYYTQPQLQRENWRAAYLEITQRYPQNAIAVFSYIAPYSPWEWYNQKNTTHYPDLSTGRLHISDVESLRDWFEPATEYEYIITFDYLRDLTDPHNELLATIESYGYQTIEILDYPHIGFIRVYAQPSTSVAQEEYLQETLQ